MTSRPKVTRRQTIGGYADPVLPPLSDPANFFFSSLFRFYGSDVVRRDMPRDTPRNRDNLRNLKTSILSPRYLRAFDFARQSPIPK